MAPGSSLLVPDGTYVQQEDKNFLVLSSKTIKDISDASGCLRILVSARDEGLAVDSFEFQSFAPPPPVDPCVDPCVSSNWPEDLADF